MKSKKDAPRKTWKTMLKHFPMLVVDGILIENGKSGLQVCLVKRSTGPFKNYWALPGGFVDKGETLQHAIVREVFEETGLRAKVLGFVNIYDSPKRDPRGHAVSIAFLLKRTGGRMKTSNETSEVKFFPESKLPKNIAFDHTIIIRDALEAYKRRK